MTGYDKKLTRAAQTRHRYESKVVHYIMFGKTWIFSKDYVRVVYNRVRPSRSHVLKADSPDGKWYHCKVAAKVKS